MKRLFPLALLLAAAPLRATLAQDITNNGATIALTGGATLYTSGSLNNSSGTLDLGNGSNQLLVGGNLTNASGATLTPGTASTVTLNGSSAQTLTLNGASLANLTINNTSGGVSLPAGTAGNATVTRVLTFTSGLVTTDPTSTLTLADGASQTGETATSYVKGNLAAVKASVSGATTFPNDITITPTAALSNLTVTRTAGLQTAQVSYGTNASGSNKGIDQIWQTSVPVAGQVQFTWLSGNDNGLTNLAQSQAWARTAAPVAGSSWDRISSGYQDASSTRTVSGTTPGTSAYAYFTASTTDMPLPVQLVAFEATRAGDAALLSWRTASELGNAYFDVEVSADGQAFRKIGQVAGHGTTTIAHDYSYSDPRLLAYAADPVYYRLRQVNTDDSGSYSPVRPVHVADALAFAVAAFPNPHGAGGTSLQVRTAQSGPLTLAAYDATGRLVFTRSADLSRGATALELPEAGRLATGVYYVRLTQAGQSAVVKLTRE